TALIAVIAVFVLAAAMRSWKRAVLVGIAFILLFAAGLKFQAPGMYRFREIPTIWKQRRWDMIASERVSPFLSAFEMFRDRPLLGQGPGTFKHHYMLYRIRVGEKYPLKLVAGAPV